LTLWDVHVWSALERWQRQYGPHVRDWLHAAGEVDALCTFAGVVHDNPGWTFPSVSAEGPLRLEARGIGHPLLRDEVRVGNDVSLGPPGTFLLLTGSNMSGKSTLLRSIGLNVVLAQAGAPCCASALSLPPVRLYTSMRVQDSLEQGLSYFMAALARLKLVVEAASAQSPAPLLYLLDEVLQGTNTAERQIAVREILMHLLERTAFGAVTTHDLALADTPELAGVAQFLHFTEHVTEKEGRVSLSFDYKLRPGIATSTNALMLMKLMGLRS
jgi:DNA mismatch repair ATPase MutS